MIVDLLCWHSIMLRSSCKNENII